MFLVEKNGVGHVAFLVFLGSVFSQATLERLPRENCEQKNRCSESRDV